MRIGLSWVALSALLFSLTASSWAEKNIPTEKKPQPQYNVLTPGAKLIAGEPGDSDFIIADKNTPLPPPAPKVIVQPAVVENKPQLNEKNIAETKSTKAPTTKSKQPSKNQLQQKQRAKSSPVKMVKKNDSSKKATTKTAKNVKKPAQVANAKSSKKKTLQAAHTPASKNKKLVKAAVKKKMLQATKAPVTHGKKLAATTKTKHIAVNKKATKATPSIHGKKLAKLGKAKAQTVKPSLHVARVKAKYPSEPTLVNDQQDMIF